ncbi:TRAP transporter small permease [Hwanghaeella sp.]|uniref:TRAP transporter small permease n=1 Tax=Hwanghaeella sp. TaxID=2605943 RepID=UPI003CCB83E5
MTDSRPEPEQATKTAEDAGPVVRILRRVLGGIAALLVFGMMVVTVIDVAGRYLFSAPLPGAFEVTEIALAVVIFLGLPLVCFEDGHISVSLITERLRGMARRLQSAGAALIGGVTLALVAWRIYEHGAQLASYGDVTIFLRLPKGPIAYLLSALTAVSAVYLILRGIRLLISRRPPLFPVGGGSAPVDRSRDL